MADHRNFTRAGDALGVTAGAASLQIKSLEEYLGRSLFKRDGRGVTLTAEGASLLPRVQQAMRDLERAIDDTRGERGSGPLRISMLSSFLQNWLLPRLPDLRARHPHIDLQVHTSCDFVDFVRSEQHAAIRLGSGNWPGVIGEKLLDEWLVPVCTPALFAKFGPVRQGHDLGRYPLVHSTSEPWTAWLLAGRAADDTTSPFSGARIDDSAAVVRLATQGFGLALARWSLAADEVTAGRLVVASPKPLSFFRSYWLVRPKRSQDLTALRDFADWLRSQLAVFPKPPGA